MKKIGLLTALDPLDKTAWSGIYFKIYETLVKEDFEVEILGPYPLNKLSNRLIFIVERIVRLFTSKRYYHHGSIISSYFRGRYFTQKLKSSDCDVILGVTSASEFAFLKTNKPLYYFTDASFGQLSSYYSNFKDLSQFSRWEANYIEKRALNKCKSIIYPSLWAKDFSVNFYEVDEKRIEVIKMGANISFPNRLNTRKELSGVVKFLFLGVDWDRKGGPLVIETLNKLRELNYDVSLIICGCTPEINEDYVEIIPFLNKNLDEDNKRLQDLLLNAHFLFVPTQAECYGIVFAEASAYGLPSITRDTGGVSSVVNDGVNGILMDSNASLQEYVKKIELLINNPNRYSDMSLASRQYFEKELDWLIFGRRMVELVEIKK